MIRLSKKKNIGKYSAIACFMALSAFPSKADGAVTITISGSELSSTAIVSLEGSLQMIQLSNLAPNGNAAGVPVVNFGGWQFLGANGVGRPTTNIATVSDTSYDSGGSGTEVGTATITRAGDPNPIFSETVDNLRYTHNANQATQNLGGIFQLVFTSTGGPPTSSSTARPYPIDSNTGSLPNTGELTLSLSGSFDLDLGTDTFGSRFIPGTHTGSYNNQDVNIIVQTIPEVGSTLLLSLGAACLILRRGRVSQAK